MKKQETVLIPETLLKPEEVKLIKSSRIPIPLLHTRVLNCGIYKMKEDQMLKILTSDVLNRALALRIVSKALSIKRTTPEAKMAMLAVASGLASSFPAEADRIVRAV